MNNEEIHKNLDNIYRYIDQKYEELSTEILRINQKILDMMKDLLDIGNKFDNSIKIQDHEISDFKLDLSLQMNKFKEDAKESHSTFIRETKEVFFKELSKLKNKYQEQSEQKITDTQRLDFIIDQEIRLVYLDRKGAWNAYSSSAESEVDVYAKVARDAIDKAIKESGLKNDQASDDTEKVFYYDWKFKKMTEKCKN